MIKEIILVAIFSFSNDQYESEYVDTFPDWDSCMAAGALLDNNDYNKTLDGYACRLNMPGTEMEYMKRIFND